MEFNGFFLVENPHHQQYDADPDRNPGLAVSGRAAIHAGCVRIGTGINRYFIGQYSTIK